MATLNKLLIAPPYSVEQTLKHTGANLRIARLRRNLTIEEVAEKIGTGSRAVRDAEKGKPSTAVAVYMALLWTFDFLKEFDQIADPTKDEEGQILSLAHMRKRAGHNRKTDNNF